ncbi:MAG: hypothetical protein DRP81_08865 [Candidatus Omnitrophota bacterium]|nr:MAG: hypothetical protein DRP81_08865 [Candidatus Omnitrophota bacterium]
MSSLFRVKIRKNILIIIIFLFLPNISFSQLPVKLGILPLKIYSSQDLNYLRQGISEMLKSRLSWKEYILVVIDVPEEVFKDAHNIEKVGQKLNIDYILSGSLTIFGGGASIDLRLINIKDGKVTPFCDQCDNLNKIIPKIGELTEKITQKLVPLAKEKNKPSVVKKPKK